MEFISALPNVFLLYPLTATSIIALASEVVFVTADFMGLSKKYIGLKIAYTMLYHFVRDRIPFMGWI